VLLRTLLVGGLEHGSGSVDLFGECPVELCCVLLDDGPDYVVVDRPVIVGDPVTHSFDQAPWHGGVVISVKVASM
jgi:hypothetical protein